MYIYISIVFGIYTRIYHLVAYVKYLSKVFLAGNPVEKTICPTENDLNHINWLLLHKSRTSRGSPEHRHPRPIGTSGGRTRGNDSAGYSWS